MATEGMGFALPGASAVVGVTVGTLLMAATDYTGMSGLVAGLVLLTGAVVTGIVQIISLKAKITADAKIAAEAAVAAAREQVAAIEAARAAIAPIAKKIDELVPIVTKIDGHVNSEKTKSDGLIATKDMQIELQREMIDELRKATSALAQAKASADLATAVSQAAVAGATTPAAQAQATPAPQTTLEKNTADTAVATAETAANTKRTEAVVQDLKDQTR